MPVGGTARFSSPITVQEFYKSTSVVALDPNTAAAIAEPAAVLAEAEGFFAHARGGAQTCPTTIDLQRGRGTIYRAPYVECVSRVFLLQGAATCGRPCRVRIIGKGQDNRQGKRNEASHARDYPQTPAAHG